MLLISPFDLADFQVDFLGLELNFRLNARALEKAFIMGDTTYRSLNVARIKTIAAIAGNLEAVHCLAIPAAWILREKLEVAGLSLGSLLIGRWHRFAGSGPSRLLRKLFSSVNVPQTRSRGASRFALRADRLISTYGGLITRTMRSAAAPGLFISAASLKL